MRILLIEDDKELCEFIKAGLQQAGHDVNLSHDGEEGLYYMEQNVHDIVLLDRMLPSLDGISMLRKARRKGNTTPVLLITAMNQINDRVEGLDAGADDYLVKPFDLRELLARIRALARRPQAMEENAPLRFSDISLSTDNLLLEGEKGRYTLSKREAELLELFIKNAKTTLSREFLFNRIWGSLEVEEASLDIYIHFIRRHLKAVSNKVNIRTHRKVGYCLENCDD